MREREKEKEKERGSDLSATASTSTDKSPLTPTEPIYCTVKDDINKSITPTPTTPMATTPTSKPRFLCVFLTLTVVLFLAIEPVALTARNSFGKASVQSFGKTSTGNSFGKGSIGGGSAYR